MWIAFRLILALVGYVVRQLSRGRVPKSNGYVDGIPYFENVQKSKGRVQGFMIGMQRRSPTWVRLHAESMVDRWFKRIGIANEVQTGDPKFDDKVYVTCDHPYVNAILQETPALRDAIHAAIDAGYQYVRFDGSSVRMERKSNIEPSDRDLQFLKAIHVASAKLEDEMPSRFADPFLWKALVVEGVIWSIAGYAIGAGIQMSIHREDFHVSQEAVIKLGIVVAIAAFIALVGLVVLWMRGSSRGHRVIVESALVLLICLPVTGIQVIGDTNRAFDNARSLQLTRAIERCEVREHRGKRGRRWYSYHLWIVNEAEASGPRLPREIETTREICNAASPGSTLEVALGPGRWGVPWYRTLSVGGETWSAPM